MKDSIRTRVVNYITNTAGACVEIIGKLLANCDATMLIAKLIFHRPLRKHAHAIYRDF